MRSSREKIPRQRSGIAGRLALWIVFLALLVAIAEGVVGAIDARARQGETRVLDWGTLRAIQLEEARPGRRIEWVPRGEFFDFSDGFLEPRPYVYEVDEEGYLMPSRVHSDPDLTILFQGGSTTEIVFVDPELRFAHRVGRLIEASEGIEVNTLNAGVSGSCTLDSINSLLNKHLAQQPDVAVMMEAINDLNTLIYNHNSYYGKVRNPIVEIPQRPGRRRPTVGQSLARLFDDLFESTIPHLHDRAGNLLRHLSGAGDRTDEFAAVREERRSVDADLIRDRFRRNVTLWIETARTFGITPVLMTQASRFYDDNPAWQEYIAVEIERKTRIPFTTYRELHRSFNEVVRQVGRDEGVLVIDLERRIPARSETIHDPVHFNNNGSRLAAEIIHQELVEHVL